MNNDGFTQIFLEPTAVPKRSHRPEEVQSKDQSLCEEDDSNGQSEGSQNVVFRDSPTVASSWKISFFFIRSSQIKDSGLWFVICFSTYYIRDVWCLWFHTLTWKTMMSWCSSIIRFRLQDFPFHGGTSSLVGRLRTTRTLSCAMSVCSRDASWAPWQHLWSAPKLCQLFFWDGETVFCDGKYSCKSCKPWKDTNQSNDMQWHICLSFQR